MKPSRAASIAALTVLVVVGAVFLAKSPSHKDSPQATGQGTSAGDSPAGTTSTAGTTPGGAASTPGTAATSSGASAPKTSAAKAAGAGLDDPRKKEIAMEIVSSAENSSLNWRAQYKYIEDINDGRGYTGGIIGFTSATGDMLDLVQHYTSAEPHNVLAKYIGALQALNGSSAHTGLDPTFTHDWATAAADPGFQRAQDAERDRMYFDPAVSQAKADGLRTLGQFIYYDAMVMHGPGDEPGAFGAIRAAALVKAKPPSQGGSETAYLNAFLDARKAVMLADPSHQDTSRVDTEQRVFLKAGNLDLNAPLRWSTYGDPYAIN